MRLNKQNIIKVIDSCILNTNSTRKKKSGLPKLKSEINNEDDLHNIIKLLIIATEEPAPVDPKAKDNSCTYWVNRHSNSFFRHCVKSKRTNTYLTLHNIIRSYAKNNNINSLYDILTKSINVKVKSNNPDNEAAPLLRDQYIINNYIVMNNRIIRNMKSSSRRADQQIVLLGHGETTLNKKLKIPSGTSVHFYTNDQAFLRGVDVRAIAAPEVYGTEVIPGVREIAESGTTIMDHKIGELDHSGIGHQGDPRELGGVWVSLKSKPIYLSQLLIPNMGPVHWAACRAHPTNDEIAFSKGGGVNIPNPKYVKVQPKE